jgi:hypothetical protein
VDDLLEMSVYPFGEIAQCAVDTAHDRASLPGVFVDLGGYVELWQPALELCQPSEICLLVWLQVVTVSLE